jgi:hypothetical protein
MLLSRRINNLSIRNKLRLFTLGTCIILTVFFLVSVWMSTNRAVHQDVRGELRTNSHPHLPLTTYHCSFPATSHPPPASVNW